jgi:predicted DNA-binding transcriptional regulator AlpA
MTTDTIRIDPDGIYDDALLYDALGVSAATLPAPVATADSATRARADAPSTSVNGSWPGSRPTRGRRWAMADSLVPRRPFPEAPANGTSRATPQPMGTPPAPPESGVSCRPGRLAAAVEQLLLAAPEAAALCGVSEATGHRMNAAGRCPAPLRLSRGCVRWSRETLVEWIRLGAPTRKEFQARTQRNPT